STPTWDFPGIQPPRPCFNSSTGPWRSSGRSLPSTIPSDFLQSRLAQRPSGEAIPPPVDFGERPPTEAIGAS
ncbi:MAG: hypothetical protein ACK56I_17025, partial [bacterium]